MLPTPRLRLVLASSLGGALLLWLMRLERTPTLKEGKGPHWGF